MPKKILLFGTALLAASGIFLVFAFAAVAGGSEPVPQLASEETTLTYAQTASKLSAPWDIVMLTDAVRSVIRTGLFLIGMEAPERM